MIKPVQLPLFSEEKVITDTINDNKSHHFPNAGTFKESMRAPIHGWFRYPAGYSFRFVEAIFDHFDIEVGNWVYDPFSGTGTTLLSASQRGLHACGVEAHSFVHHVASVKLFRGYNFVTLRETLENLLTQCYAYVMSNIHTFTTEGLFPELVYKCYHPLTLKELALIKAFILENISDIHLSNLLKLALTDALRAAAAAGTGWPYIAPNKNTGDKPPKDALNIFKRIVQRMCSDLLLVSRHVPDSTILNVLGDSRLRQNLENEQIDLALTSPPYLNNYDYADRTRLETYFWGIARSWGEITQQFRNKLMVAATTQIVRRNYIVEEAVSKEIQQLDNTVYQAVRSAVLELSKRRLTKGGKKDYDLMVALYFNDMLAVLKETYRVVKPDGKFCLVLGDSAPYGVHIPTETLIGNLALGVGFRGFDYEEFRTRGGKWKQNPQRHTVALREGVVILTR